MTLIPLLDLLNHKNGGAMSKHTGYNPGQDIVAYVKLATMTYKAVGLLSPLAGSMSLRLPFSSHCFMRVPSVVIWQGNEVWAAYMAVSQYESCNQAMFRT